MQTNGKTQGKEITAHFKAARLQEEPNDGMIRRLFKQVLQVNQQLHPLILAGYPIAAGE